MSLKAEASTALTAALETAINAYLQMDPDTLQRLGDFADKVIAIEMQDTGIILYCLPEASGINIMSQYHGEPDTIIAGRPVSLAKLGLLHDTQVMFEGEVTIRGDVELGQRFKRLLENMDIDWEEHLSRVVGDVIAHKTGHAIREMASWWRNNRERAQENSREYLQEEIQLVPSREEVETLYQDVETLRDDVARLAARIANLESRRSDDKT